MNPLLLPLLFIIFLVLIEAVFGLMFKKNPEKLQTEKRLKELTAQKYEFEDLELVKKVKYSDVPSLNSFFSKFSVFHRMVSSLEQAGIRQPLGLFILITLVGIAVGYALTRINLLFGIIAVIVFGVFPSAYVYAKKKERMKKFERQLPDAMDLISRSLRAGLAFSAGLKIVADEFPDPIGIEFAKTVNEINFGISTDEALKNLSLRVDCPDLKFFVISVILQKETGGNLSEILENISRLIRERFKFQGKVRALSAEGRLSAIILIAIPFFIAAVASIFNPKYISVLRDEPLGNTMVVLALMLMVFGSLIIRKMVRLKV